ncbi:hypothetical protein [Nocardia fusca]|uniref:Uncharacterized protein n=1 Tax=Nocardia fusca TaxID=941183 RepID=A0ABV3FIE5_9NOCA
MTLRTEAERRSTAPRFVGVTAFADIAGVAPADLSRWRRQGPVWVPTPDVLLGEISRPGWDAELAKSWTPEEQPYPRPDPVQYWDLPEMQRRHAGMRAELLWTCLVVDGTIRWPDVWVDSHAGWLPK